jgi:hypothetical protein
LFVVSFPCLAPYNGIHVIPHPHCPTLYFYLCTLPRFVNAYPIVPPPTFLGLHVVLAPTSRRVPRGIAGDYMYRSEVATENFVSDCTL